MKLLAILLFAFILRVISINQSFWLDEATSVTVARNFSFSEIITTFSRGDFHPPLYYLLLKAWMGIIGVSEVSARLLSVAFALGTIIVVYYIGKEINHKVGYISALLLATSPLHIYYSQEARMYVPVTFFSTLAIYLFLKRKWLLFAISLICIGATDYVGLFVIPAFFIVAILQRKTFPWKSFLVSFIPLILAFIAWFPLLSVQLTGGLAVEGSNWWAILGGVNFKNLALLPVKFLIGRISFDNKILYAAIIGAVGIFYAFAFLKGVLHPKSRYLAIFLFVPITGVFLLSLKIPVFYYFRLLFCLPVFYLLTSLGTIRVKFRENILIAMLIVSNLFLAGHYLFTNKFHREDWKQATKVVQNESLGNYIVLFPANSQMEAYRYYDNKSKVAGGVDSVSGDYQTIWLMRYVQDIFDPEDLVRKKVEEIGYKKLSEYNFNGVVIYKYEK